MANVIVIPRTIEENHAVNERRRVAAYARVSTDYLEQHNSYEAQYDHYFGLIGANSQWELVKIYTDEGSSGTGIKWRRGFCEMMADAAVGKIDLIVTKSISRFARNTLDSLNSIRTLKDNGVEVFFEKENLYTFSPEGEFIVSILSSLAQEESRSISENVKWTVRNKFASGVFSLPYKRFLGYRRGAGGVPFVVEGEAKTVREIYSDFLRGMNPSAIAKKLTSNGVKTPGGKKQWYRSTVYSILTNEKYKGDALLQKRYTRDYLDKKKEINRGEIPMYYVKGSHEAIVSPEIFARVQKKIAQRRLSRHDS